MLLGLNKSCLQAGHAEASIGMQPSSGMHSSSSCSDLVCAGRWGRLEAEAQRGLCFPLGAANNVRSKAQRWVLLSLPFSSPLLLWLIFDLDSEEICQEMREAGCRAEEKARAAAGRQTPARSGGQGRAQNWSLSWEQ